MKNVTKSITYWENRYKANGNSGSGSMNDLQIFKSDTINQFIKQNNIESLIEYGSGDGNQAQQLKVNKYIGFDVSDTVIAKCIKRFRDDKSKHFIHYDGMMLNTQYFNSCDLTISTDVLFHLIEQNVYDLYIENLFKTSNKYVIIYSYDYDSKPTDNFSWHYKPRNFTNIIKNKFTDWDLITTIDNMYPVKKFGTTKGSYSNFYIYKKK